MKTAGIKQFKTQLSSFLREVRGGETVLVTDRGQVVAEVRPPGRSATRLTPEQARYQKAIETGLIRPARLPAAAFRKKWSRFKSLGLADGTTQAVLDELREDRLR